MEISFPLNCKFRKLLFQILLFVTKMLETLFILEEIMIKENLPIEKMHILL